MPIALEVVAVPLRSLFALVRRPGALPLLVSSLVGRIGRASSALTVVLVVAASTRSYAWAGLAAAALTLADAVTAPLKARANDRLGPAKTLVPLAFGHAGALLALVVAGGRPAPTLACAALAGTTFPPLSGASKALWPGLVSTPGQLSSAYALESFAQQLLFFAGPLYATAATALGSPALALRGIALGTVLGTLGVVAVGRRVAPTRLEPTPDSVPGTVRGTLGALGVPTVALLAVLSLLQTLTGGALGVAVPALAASAGAGAGLAGPILACGPIGGMVGSVVNSARWRYATLYAAMSLAALPMVLGIPVVVGLCYVGFGLLVTPLAARAYVMVQRRTPRSLRTEAFSWLSTANAAGAGLGALVSGLAVQHAGVGLALAIPAGGTGLAALVAWAYRRTIAASEPEPEPEPDVSRRAGT